MFGNSFTPEQSRKVALKAALTAFVALCLLALISFRKIARNRIFSFFYAVHEHVSLESRWCVQDAAAANTAYA
jgi:hypothetical protein